MRPQNDYLTVYRTFYKPRRLAQLVVHYALDSPSADRDAFEVFLELCEDDGILGRPWKLKDLQSDARVLPFAQSGADLSCSRAVSLRSCAQNLKMWTMRNCAVLWSPPR